MCTPPSKTEKEGRKEKRKEGRKEKRKKERKKKRKRQRNVAGEAKSPSISRIGQFGHGL